MHIGALISRTVRDQSGLGRFQIAHFDDEYHNLCPRNPLDVRADVVSRQQH
jgi:hypothetical protein